MSAQYICHCKERNYCNYFQLHFCKQPSEKSFYSMQNAISVNLRHDRHGQAQHHAHSRSNATGAKYVLCSPQRMIMLLTGRLLHKHRARARAHTFSLERPTKQATGGAANVQWLFAPGPNNNILFHGWQTYYARMCACVCVYVSAVIIIMWYTYNKRRSCARRTHWTAPKSTNFTGAGGWGWACTARCLFANITRKVGKYRIIVDLDLFGDQTSFA